MEHPSNAFGHLRITARDEPVKLHTMYLSGVGVEKGGQNGMGSSREARKTNATDEKNSFMAFPPEIRLKVRLIPRSMEKKKRKK